MQKLIALLGALIAAAALSLVASPAQAAYGWSGQRCSDQSGSNAARICAQVHTIPSGNGAVTDQVQICAYKVPQAYYNGFRGTKSNYLQYWGSGGAFLGGDNLNATGASQGGSCSYTNVYQKTGNGACYVAMGILDLAGAPDGSFYIRGSILGGAC